MALVLVVDDDPEVRNILKSFIEAAGHTVELAANTGEAWQALAKAPQVIFLDIDMPRETGVDFMFRVRQHPEHKEVRVAFVSAHPERASALQQTGRGADLVIAKPFRREAVVEGLRKLLRRGES